MKFRVERDALADALAWVARALPSRPVVPVLSGLRLEAGDGLTLSCFDYEVSATAQLDAEVEEPGAVLVPGRLLAEITRSLPALAVDFAADGDVVNLTCGSAEFTVVQLPGDEYPSLPEPPPLAGTVDGGDLAAAIGQVLPAASRDDTLPMLTGVCLDIEGEALTLAATDRYRLAVREMEWHPVRPGLRAVALAPARTLADAARTMASGSPVSIGFEAGGGSDQEPRPAEGMISFGMGGRRLTARLIGGEFIRYRSRFPSEYGCRADVPAGPFTEAVRRVSLVADRASPVRLAFGPGSVVVEAQTEGRARAVETVTAEFHGDQPVISFNPHYLLDGLVAAAAQAHPRHAADHADAAGSAGGSGSGDAGSAGTGSAGTGSAGTGSAGTGSAGTGSAGTGSAGTADASPGGAGGGDAGAGGSADPGLLRLEFTSPAKPALITRAQGSGAQGSESDRAAPAGVPQFRYLVVPLRAAVRS
jgi:DNA polymerase-3 subunit beta